METKKKRKSRTNKDIVKQQKKHSLSIQKAPFKRLVKNLIGNSKITKQALSITQLVLENFLVKLLNDARVTNDIVTKEKKKTLEGADLIPPLSSNSLTKASFQKWIDENLDKIHLESEKK